MAVKRYQVYNTYCAKLCCCHSGRGRGGGEGGEEKEEKEKERAEWICADSDVDWAWSIPIVAARVAAQSLICLEDCQRCVRCIRVSERLCAYICRAPAAWHSLPPASLSPSLPPVGPGRQPWHPTQSNHRSRRLITETSTPERWQCQYPTLSLSVWIAHPHCQINRVEN